MGTQNARKKTAGRKDGSSARRPVFSNPSKPTNFLTFFRPLIRPLTLADLVARKAASFAIRGYQIVISPLFGRPVCRFHPSCSEYGRQAFQRHPFFKALLLAAWRVLRCNPWSRGGPDPVP